jgi:hypothetical protein
MTRDAASRRPQLLPRSAPAPAKAAAFDDFKDDIPF